MKPGRDTIEQRMRTFNAACARLGIKITHQRMEIFRAVISTEEHPDAETIHRWVKKRIPTISLDTVYRNLRLLAEHDLIAIVGMSQENLRFDGNAHPHHHFVCVRCGKIRDFAFDAPDSLQTPKTARVFGEPLSVHLEVKGICTGCRGDVRR